MSLEDGARVKSWLGTPGTVHFQQMWGSRQPQPMIRFQGRLHYHRAWLARPFVRESGAER